MCECFWLCFLFIYIYIYIYIYICIYIYIDIYMCLCVREQRVAAKHYYCIQHRKWNQRTVFKFRYYRLDKKMETPRNFKQIYFDMVFWLQPSREIRLCWSLLTVWVLEMIIKLCCNFQSCVFYISIPIRLRVRRSPADSFRFLPEFCFGKEVLLSFLNAVMTFKTARFDIPNNSVVLLH